MIHSLLASFIESIIYWFYLTYGTLVINFIAQYNWTLLTDLDSHFLQFFITFVLDYVWRRFLAVGYCIDPGILVIRFVQKGKCAPSLKYIILHLLTCLVSGTVVFALSIIIHPIEFARWSPEYGVGMCFLIEFILDFLHQARNALYNIISDSINHDQVSHGECKAYGSHSIASFYTAAIIMEGAYVTQGGPMLNVTYTLMASLAFKDSSMFLILGSANLLAAYCAGSYVRFVPMAVKQKVS